MKNKIKIAAFFAVCVMLVQAAAYADDVFLCMRGGDNIALTADKNGILKYIDMIDSNGTRVVPQVSVSGNTYLPFRFICDMAGLKDASGSVGELEDNSFRFIDKDVNTDGSFQKIELKYNGNYISHNVGEEFSYILSEGDERTVSIYNINGSLYFPMSYMAKITGSKTFWNNETKDIIYSSSGIDPYRYIDENNCLKSDVMLKNGYYSYCNNLNNNGLYLKSDGVTISDIGKENNEKAICAGRINDTVYYISEGIIKKSKEESGVSENVKFKDIQDNDFYLHAETLIPVKNRLYGIDSENGKVFEAYDDGHGFKYLTDRAVYNLIIREYNNEFYMYYCESESRSRIYMMPLKTMDSYEIEITDMEHNNLIENVEMFVIGTSIAAYKDFDNVLHTIILEDPLEKFEIVRVNASDHKIHLVCEEGLPLSDIYFMNYDIRNNTLFISGKSDVFYTITGESIKRFRDVSMNGVSLFYDINGKTILSGYNEKEYVNVLYMEN